MFLDSNDSDVKVDAGSSFNKKVCFLLILEIYEATYSSSEN